MYRRSTVTLGVWSQLQEELKKIPAYFTYQAGIHVDSVGKAVEFLKGDAPGESPEMKEKRRKHKEMYNAILRKQNEQMEELKKKHAAQRAQLSRYARMKENMKELKEALQQATSAQAGAMALLQHCTASHAAEVAIEQGIDVKNVQMVIERQSSSSAVGHEEVVVGYIDAPNASEEEVMVFAEKLQKACPIANRMTVEWKKSRADDEEKTVDFDTFACSQDAGREVDGRAGSSHVADIPRGMAGSRRWHTTETPPQRSESFGDDESFHLPGVPRRHPGTEGNPAKDSSNESHSSTVKEAMENGGVKNDTDKENPNKIK